jgi:phenylacetate-coenzyme A ligase PaaK-like adenylate-forming protein
LICLTGGTLKTPRRIVYDRERYMKSVEVTREILVAHGVCTGMRVVVCHPFEPWAIGGVFRDAALACGAVVLPLGLTAGEPALRDVLVADRTDVLCGTATLLVRWRDELDREGRPRARSRRLVFHAAEPLRPTVREACSRAWNARVVDVYGMAEFDSVASDGPDRPGLILSPHLRYGLGNGSGNRVRALAAGAEGELLIFRKQSRRWHRTRDLVRVIEKVPPKEALWPKSWRIEHLGRSDDALKLPDGSLLSVQHLEAVIRDFPGIGYVQGRLNRRSSGPTQLKLLASPTGLSPLPSHARLKRAILAHCLELADSVKHAVVALEVAFVDESRLVRTDRGKVKPFVEDNS